jgi:phage-related protein (TIGR01555 family)
MGFWDFFRRRKPAAVTAPAEPALDAEYEDNVAYERRYGPSRMLGVDEIKRQVQDGRGPLSPKAFDAVANWMTGQGGTNDPATAMRYLFAATTDWQTISNMCRASWLARKIVWKRPRDMMRPGYNLIFEGMGDKAKGATETSGDRLRKSITRRWDADNKLIEGMAWGREFGGAIIVIDIKGQLLEDPLPIKDGMVDYSSIKKGTLNSLRVWDRWRANHDGQLDNDNESPNRGKPTFYVLSADGGLAGQKVHWTRVLRFDGDIVDWWTWRANACWHDSVLQVVIDTLKQYDMLTSAISSLVPKARQDIVYAKDAAKLASTAEGRAGMAARFAATHRMASMYNVRVYDMDKEKTEQQTFSFGGLDNIWQKAMMETGAGASYPSSVLFDNQPSGLNASGESSVGNYFDDLAAERLNYLKPRQLALYEVIARNEFDVLPEGFDIDYKAFRSASEIEKSTINLNRANADAARLKDGVITAGLVAAQLKEDSVYSVMTQEDVDLAKLAPPPPEDDGSEPPDGSGGTKPAKEEPAPDKEDAKEEIETEAGKKGAITEEGE